MNQNIIKKFCAVFAAPAQNSKKGGVNNAPMSS